jgi:xanthine dehydrogenase accessory factor
MSEALAVYEALTQAQREGKIAALATVIRTQGSVPRQAGSKMLVWPDGNIVGTIGGGMMEALVVQEGQQIMRSGQPNTFTYKLSDLKDGDPGICGGTVEIFVEPVGLVPTVVVIGCGHVGKALAELAKWSGFRVVVSDDRAELCSPEAIPNMDGYYPVLLEQLEIGPLTFITAVTRGLPVDVRMFPRLVESKAPYIGLIGSKRRWALTRKTLIEEYQVAEALVDRVHAPIGLEIHAETPQEIAISIMAEIISHSRGVDHA